MILKFKRDFKAATNPTINGRAIKLDLKLLPSLEDTDCCFISDDGYFSDGQVGCGHWKNPKVKLVTQADFLRYTLLELLDLPRIMEGD